MATKKISGAAGDTIISDSYAHGTVVVTGPPDRPDKSSEDFDRERKADRITYSAVLKQFGWTDDDFSTAKGYNFPRSIGQKISAWGGATEWLYSRKAIAQWRANLAAFVSRMPK
jgi:hypothetical protein